MFLTSLSTAGIYEPADHTSQDKQRPPPDPLVEHPAGVFTINFSAQFTHSHCTVSQRQAAATQIRRAGPHEPARSNETPRENTSSGNHRPASPG